MEQAGLGIELSDIRKLAGLLFAYDFVGLVSLEKSCEG